MKSNFVCAGYETLAIILNNFIEGKTKRFKNHFTREQIGDFFAETCNMFLHSFGQNFAGKKTYKNHIKNEVNLYKKTRSWGFFDKSLFIPDSGGFQISIGKLSVNESEILIELYHQFLKEHSDVYDRAFVLDLPPGPGCKIFKNFDQVYEKNLETYMMAANLPEEARKKMIYIHHFRTPKLWEIYTKIMRENDLFDKFQYHATGGIVANSSQDTSIPCIIYVIPMIPLLNEVKRHGRDYLNFHILGGANFRDILFYELFKINIQKNHGINVEITYDSSSLFKGLMVGRFIPVLDEGILRKLDLRSNNLSLRFLGGEKVEVRFKRLFKTLHEKFNFKDISSGEIYNPKTNTFYDEVRVYSMLYMLNQFSELQTILSDEAKRIYPLYECGQTSEFIKEVQYITQSLNGGKISRKQKAKSISIVKSLEMLTNLDEEYCKHIVNKVLSKDEFTNLGERRTLSI